MDSSGIKYFKHVFCKCQYFIILKKNYDNQQSYYVIEKLILYIGVSYKMINESSINNYHKKVPIMFINTIR